MKFQFRMRFASSAPIEVEIAAEFDGKSYAEQMKEALRVVLDAHRKWRNGDKNSSRANLSDADLSGADLSGADLSDADLSDADLSGANLPRADLSGAKVTDKAGNVITVTRTPLILRGLDYPVMVWDQHLKIGCEMHKIADWRDFDDRRIAEMDGLRATHFWKRHKVALLALAESDGRGVANELPVAIAAEG